MLKGRPDRLKCVKLQVGLVVVVLLSISDVGHISVIRLGFVYGTMVISQTGNLRRS